MSQAVGDSGVQGDAPPSGAIAPEIPVWVILFITLSSFSILLTSSSVLTPLFAACGPHEIGIAYPA